MSQAYKEGIAAGKLESTTEFDNPYQHGTQQYKDWEKGFFYIRGEGDTVTS